MTTYTPDSNFQFYTDDEGNAFCTQAGLGKLAGVDGTAVRNYRQNGVNLEAKMAEVLTKQGLRGVYLIPSKDAFTYIKQQARKGNEIAWQTIDTLGDAGLVTYIQHITNFQRATEAVERSLTWMDLRRRHTVVYNAMKKIGSGNVTDYLNVAYYGKRCDEMKVLRMLHQDSIGDYLPDRCELEELEELVTLRENFINSQGDYKKRTEMAVRKTRKQFNK